MQIEAVVVGDGLNALGVLRSLGRHGLGLALVSRSGKGIANRSRFASIRLALHDADSYDPESIRTRLKLRPGQATLFLTEELDVLDCLAAPEPWQNEFRSYLYTPEVASVLVRKSGFDRLAREAGAPLPRTVVLRPDEGLAPIDGLRFPLAVKPTVRDPQFSARFEKAYKVTSPGELVDLFSRMRGIDLQLVVQEWVEGNDYDIYFNLIFVDADGEVCSSFVGQKVLCWPPSVGGTASCIAAPLFHEQLSTMTSTLLYRTGFRGMIGLEYKRDLRDGKFYMIEPTVYRTDYQHEIATLSGCDFLYRIHARCLGRALEPQTRYTRHKHWVDFPASRYSRQAAPDGGPRPPGLRRVDAHFRLHDPMPGLAHYLRHFKSKAMAILRRNRRTRSEEHSGTRNDQ